MPTRQPLSQTASLSLALAHISMDEAAANALLTLTKTDAGPSRTKAKPVRVPTTPSTNDELEVDDSIYVSYSPDVPEAYYAQQTEGHALDTSEVTTSLDVIPFSWRCCHCDTEQWLVQPGHTATEPVTAAKFKASLDWGEMTDSDFDNPNEPCIGCHKRRCIMCVLLNFYNTPLSTVGNNSLHPHRLTPHGWSCCVCTTPHHPQPRLSSSSVPLPFPHPRRFLGHTCSCAHTACTTCRVINVYDERLARLDERDLILDTDSGLLRDHLLWFQTWLQVQHYEVYGVGWDEEERKAVLEDAGHEVAKAREVVEGVRGWIGEFRAGIEGRVGG